MNRFDTAKTYAWFHSLDTLEIIPIATQQQILEYLRDRKEQDALDERQDLLHCFWLYAATKVFQTLLVLQ